MWVPTSVNTITGVSRSEKVQGMVLVDHWISIFGGPLPFPLTRLFFCNTTDPPSKGEFFLFSPTSVESESIVSGADGAPI